MILTDFLQFKLHKVTQMTVLRFNNQISNKSQMLVLLQKYENVNFTRVTKTERKTKQNY